MTTDEQFIVGQKLFVLYSGRRMTESENEIITVGTKWVTLSHGNPRHRFPRHHSSGRGYWVIDGRGFSSPGIVFLTEADARQYQCEQKLRGEFRSQLNRVDVNNLSQSQIREAAKALGMEIRTA